MYVLYTFVCVCVRVCVHVCCLCIHACCVCMHVCMCACVYACTVYVYVYNVTIYVTVHAKRYHKSAIVFEITADFALLFPFLPSYKI